MVLLQVAFVFGLVEALVIIHAVATLNLEAVAVVVALLTKVAGSQ